jgi:hypothetical protein
MFIIDYPILPRATPNGPPRISPTLAVIELTEEEYIRNYAPNLPTKFGIRYAYETHAIVEDSGTLTGRYQLAKWQHGGQCLKPFGPIYDSEAEADTALHALLLQTAQENPHASFVYETWALAEDCLADLLNDEPL